MLYKKVLILLFTLWGTLGLCQQIELSALAKVSVLTVGTGDELHSKFGHSAVRIIDPTIGLDLVYNYGMFDFNDPNFYSKFTRGKLDYRIGRETFPQFIRTYQHENRWVKEQILNLSNADIKALFRFLENNYLPENQYYKYDFLFDNCATRIPDALQKATDNQLAFAEGHLKEHFTFRQLIHQNLEVNSWSNFGIDLALGSVIDKKATPVQHMFLPLYVFEQLKNTTVAGKPLVYKERELWAERPVDQKGTFFLSPLFWLSILTLAVVIVTYTDFKKKRRSRWLDFLLFFSTGAAGILILFLWFATDHTATKMNFNALWAIAPNLIIAFVLLKKKLPDWLQTYLYILLGLIVIILILWLLKVQLFSPLILFLIVALVVRYLFLIRFSSNT